ncbi:MAG: 4-hydroxy-tetrahydrodipicolinate synthase [Puniceicoccaceae bacterium]|nr:MAG: 4-hydroxy-tetrahydrodipicolinate synthase [Puniceicoccaceae bacterium]
MATHSFQGTYTALATPLKNKAVDFESLGALVEHQIKADISGLVSVGTTGESPTLSHDEHLAVIKATVDLARGKVPVFAGTGSNSTAEAVELTQRADQAGADGFLLVAPYYNKPSQEGLFAHFSAIAEVTEKPIILYSIPSRCGIEISVDVTARLYENYPQICCMKAAEGSCDKVAQYIKRLGSSFSVLSGDDALTLPFMSAGAQGVISVASNLIASPIVEMVNLANDNDYSKARQLFLKYYHFFNAIFLEPNPVPIKYCLARAGIIASEAVHLPLAPLSEPTKAYLDQLLKEYNIIE